MMLDIRDTDPGANISKLPNEDQSRNSVTSDSIQNFNRELQAVVQEAASEGISVDDAFFEHMAARLEAAGEIDTADRAFYERTYGSKTVRIDGSAGDPRDSGGVLSVIICDFYHGDAPVTVNATHAKRLFSHLVNFLVLSAADGGTTNPPDGTPGAGVADMISSTWEMTTKIKLILLTNAVYSARTDAVPAGVIDGIPATYNIWDLQRFYRYEQSGQAREVLLIDFQNEFGGAVPALAASRSGEHLESYLAVVPGHQLAEIYDKWGARLLESNVRSFLQARRKVNQGIRDTIKSEPTMFFAYNNGLSATADSVETELTSEGLKILSAKNLQIVNGGQTTASIHAATRTPTTSLSNVYVQMKLTVVPSVRSDDVVAKISQYANMQNKVSVADFFSNHPFHIRIEEYSRRVLAPATEIRSAESRWFYERAHGQYLVERSKCSDAERRKFDLMFPKAQFFSKTDLAKVEFSFCGKPDSVSKGAQKNFSEFSKEIGEIWSKSDVRFDEAWYRRAIAKLIVFRRLEKIIPKQDWYPGGYRANIVTYAIAKLAADAKEKDQLIDLDTVWQGQCVPEDLERALLKAGESAVRSLTQSVAGIKNITEWAKKQACWESLRNQNVQYGSEFERSLVGREDVKSADKQLRRDAVVVSGIEAQTKVVSEGAGLWILLREWGSAKRAFSIKEDGILKACTMTPARIPSEKQCLAAVEILERSTAEGFTRESTVPKVKLNGWSRQH